VYRRRARIALVAALGLASLAPGFARGAARPHATGAPLSATVSNAPTGQSMGPGFLGVSFEYRALHLYTGRDPRAVNPVLLALLQGLAPGQAPVIRIGGDSTDGSWWPIRGMIARAGIYYRITEGWLRTTQALASDLGAKLILGINLAAGRPAIAAAEGRALLAGIGRKYIDAFEIGNEPDLYGVFPWYRDRRGHVYRSRTRAYNLNAYTRQFTQWSRALPTVPLAGPATSGPGWMGGLGRFITAEPRLKLVTYHRYPLRACETDPTSPTFPSISNLLADSSSSGLARGLAAYVTVAHQHELPFRVGEMNSASCQGAKGVSDSFASALWVLDTMFNLAGVGVDGVNLHMLPGSNYELFTVSHSAAGAWQAFVHPEYYGLLMFEQAFPPGARLLPVTAPGGPVKIWATQGADGVTRVVVINQDPTNDYPVSLQPLGGAGPASLETLQAPLVSSTSDVTLGGQTFGPETSTGTLPGPLVTTPVTPTLGAYSLDVPPASAELLTIGG
jgi:hypothetical protein